MDYTSIKIQGHVLISDAETGHVILNKRNAIHIENMSVAIASAMSNAKNSYGFLGNIHSFAFGNGGTSVNDVGLVTYNSPKNALTSDVLYNQTYSIVINNTEEEDSNNNISFTHYNGSTFSDIIITATLDYSEPSSQDSLDDAATRDGDYVFDEIGLFSQQGKLLTHLVFHPVQKSANGKFQFVYTVRISIG